MGEISVEWLMAQPSFINYCLRVNEQDVAYWGSYIQAHPAELSLIREAEEEVKLAGWLLLAEQAKPAALEQLDAYLLQDRRPRLRWYYAATAVAAAVLLLFGLLPAARKTAPVPPLAVKAAQPLQYSTVGQPRKGFILPDSSFVLLESGSTLLLDTAFSQAERRMFLQGTAYFKVYQDQHHPFSVYAGSYVITALGTAFRVTEQKGQLQVFLEEGKVRVEKETGGAREGIAQLLPSEQLLIDPAKKQKTAYAPAELNAWKAQEIVFDHTLLQEVIQQLEACYTIRIVVEGVSLRQETFSGRFRHDALADVLDMLCFTLNKQYQLSSDSATVLIK